MADLYPNLPSVNVSIKDGGLVLTQQNGGTKSTLLIGFATDGTDGEPYAVTNVSTSQGHFGRTSDLSLAIGQAYNAGCRDVRVLRLGGVVATIDLVDTSGSPVDLIVANAPYSGAVYNYDAGTPGTGVKIEVGASNITVTKPTAKGGGSFSVDLTDGAATPAYKTLNTIITEINNNVKNNCVEFSLADGAVGTDTADALKAATYGLAGGSDEPATYSNNMIALQNAFEIIQNYVVDQIVLVGMYADDLQDDAITRADYAWKLAQHCSEVSERYHQTLGFIGVKPLVSTKLADIAAAVSATLALTNNYYYKEYDADLVRWVEVLDAEGNKISVGHFISVVTYPELLFLDPVVGQYYANSVAAYAGLVSALPAKSAPTNKQIPGTYAVRYILSLPQLDGLAGAGYVAFRDKITSFVVADAPTAAITGSDFKRLSTLRTVFDAIQVVRDAAEPFLGEPNDSPQHNALITAIRSGLSSMQKDGALSDFNFALSAPLASRLLGEVNIELEIVPILELRKVKTTVTLKPELTSSGN